MQKNRALQNGADLLLLYTPLGSHAVPGKYAEYVFAQKPIGYINDGPWLELIDEPGKLVNLRQTLFTLKKSGLPIITERNSYTDAAHQLTKLIEACINSNSRENQSSASNNH